MIRSLSSNSIASPLPKASPILCEWVPDSLYHHCYKCNRSFTILIRKHHCRVCGHIYCNDCSNYKIVINKYDNYHEIINLTNNLNNMNINMNMNMNGNITNIEEDKKDELKNEIKKRDNISVRSCITCFNKWNINLKLDIINNDNTIYPKSIFNINDYLSNRRNSITNSESSPSLIGYNKRFSNISNNIDDNSNNYSILSFEIDDPDNIIIINSDFSQYFSKLEILKRCKCLNLDELSPKYIYNTSNGLSKNCYTSHYLLNDNVSNIRIDLVIVENKAAFFSVRLDITDLGLFTGLSLIKITKIQNLSNCVQFLCNGFQISCQNAETGKSINIIGSLFLQVQDFAPIIYPSCESKLNTLLEFLELLNGYHHIKKRILQTLSEKEVDYRIKFDQVNNEIQQIKPDLKSISPQVSARNNNSSENLTSRRNIRGEIWQNLENLVRDRNHVLKETSFAEALLKSTKYVRKVIEKSFNSEYVYMTPVPIACPLCNGTLCI